MDQKHAMLYPPLEQGARNAMPHDQRNSASAAIGLPIEAPPSYDMAMAAGPSSSQATAAPISPGWVPSAPVVTPEGAPPSQPQSKFASDAPSAASTTRSAIVQQPRMQQHQKPLPAAPPQQQQHQQLPTVSMPTATPATQVISAALPPKLGPNPCAVTCPACGSCKTTRMSYTPNTRTHMCALLLCLVGWCCCACCVPYLMTSCRTGNHYCSKCNTFLGTFDPHKHK